MATRKGKKKPLDAGTKARRIARKVVGQVQPTRIEIPKPERKPKHKKQAEPDPGDS